ncbi:hypothetical protein BH20ACI2_BH20ACI2_29180 [soil metagenome]
MTWNDEIVKEVLRVRDEYDAKFVDDISAICADIRRKQAESGRMIVSLVKNKSKEKIDIPKAART